MSSCFFNVSTKMYCSVYLLLLSCWYVVCHTTVDQAITGLTGIVIDSKTVTVSVLISEILRSSSTIIVYDEHDYSAATIKSILDDHQRVQIYEYRKLHTFLDLHVAWILENASLAEYPKLLRFILICGLDCVQGVMIKVTEVDTIIGQGSLLRHFSTWFIVSIDPSPFLDITLDNVAIVTMDTVSRSEENLSFQNLTHMHVMQDLQKARRSGNIWNSSIFKVYTLLWKPNGREWSIVDPFRKSRDSLLTSLFPNTLKGLNGRQLILVTKQWLPSTKRQFINGELTYTGASFDVVDCLSTVFNFSYISVEPADNLWGACGSDGNWTGIIGVLQRKEADMSPVPYGITLDRKRVLDFSYTFDISEYSAVYIKKGYNNNSWLYLLSGFTWKVYICAMCSILWITCLYLYLLFWQRDMINKPKNIDGILQSCLQIGLNVPLRQGIFLPPTISSAKLLLFNWCIFVFVITAVYTGTLVAMATRRTQPNPFSSIQELAENKEYDVGALEGDYLVEVLKGSNDTTNKALYDKITRTNNIQSSRDHVVRKLLESKYVLFAAKDLRNRLKNETCNIVTMKETLFPLNKGFIYPRHSPLKKLFDPQLSVMKDSGLIDLLEKKWIRTPKQCDPPEHVPQVKLVHLKTILVTCAAGIVVAGAVLLVEIRQKI